MMYVGIGVGVVVVLLLLFAFVAMSKKRGVREVQPTVEATEEGYPGTVEGNRKKYWDNKRKTFDFRHMSNRR